MGPSRRSQRAHHRPFRPQIVRLSPFSANALNTTNAPSLLSGGADGSLSLWDLAFPSLSSPLIHHSQTHYTPRLTAPRNKHTHKNGITSLSFYAFDNEAYLSSSYDHKLQIGYTEKLTPTASWDLGSVVHAHAISPIAQHLLVACATQSSIVKLVDLKSGTALHGLLGHQGDVLAVAWSPQNEHVLASAGADGTVRLWDIRRSAACVGVLDLEDEVGIMARGGQKMWGCAHVGAANAVAWTADGSTIVTGGHDERIRVWDADTGRNTLVHFGASVRDRRLAGVVPVIVEEDGRQLVLWPNEQWILLGDIVEGRILRRLRIKGTVVAQGSKGTRVVKERVTGVAWRGPGCVEVYSGHADGVIRAWIPQAEVEAEVNEEEQVDDEVTKKRKALEEIHRDMTKRKITFT